MSWLTHSRLICDHPCQSISPLFIQPDDSFKTYKRPAEGTSMITSGFGLFQLGPFGRPIQQVSQYLLYTDINYVSGIKSMISLLPIRNNLKLNRVKMPGMVLLRSTSLLFVLTKVEFLSAPVTLVDHWVSLSCMILYEASLLCWAFLIMSHDNQAYNLYFCKLFKKMVNGNSLALPRGHIRDVMLTDFHRGGQIFKIQLTTNGWE